MSDEGYGQLAPTDLTSDFNRQSFLINQILARVRTMVLVKVVTATGEGAVAAPGTVSVQPLVNMTDGQGNSTPHGTINNIPVFRVQGGGNAIILDPAVGDIGWMAVADRDISAVKATSGEVSNPGSLRKFDLADGVYIGGFFGDAPTQYIQFNSDGVTIADKNGNKLVMSSTGNEFTGGLKVNGTLEAKEIEVVDGNLTVNGTLDVKGATTLEAALDVKGAALLESTLHVQQTTTADANINVTGTVQASVQVQVGAGTHTLTNHTHGVVVLSTPSTVSTGTPSN